MHIGKVRQRICVPVAKVPIKKPLLLPAAQPHLTPLPVDWPTSRVSASPKQRDRR